MNKFRIATLAILTLGLIAGQLIKVPVNGLNGIDLLDLCIFVLCLVGLAKGGVKFPFLPKYILIFGGFFLLGGIFLFFSPLKLNINQSTISWLYPARYLMYLFFSLEIANKKLPVKKDDLLTLIISSSTILAALGLVQLIFIPNLAFLAPLGWDPHYFRMASTLLDPNFLGVYLTLGLLMIINNPARSLNRPKNLLMLSVNYLALLTTFSRSAALMFLVSMGFLNLFKKSKRLIILSLVLFLGFGISFLIYRQTISIPRNIDRGQSAGFRLNSYQEGTAIFKNSPLTGTGFNAYRYALSKYRLADETTIQSRGGAGNDSSLLFVLATTGLIGELIFLLALSDITYISIKKTPNHPLAIIYLSFLAGVLVNCFFINSLFYQWVFLWIILIPVYLVDEKSN